MRASMTTSITLALVLLACDRENDTVDDAPPPPHPGAVAPTPAAPETRLGLVVQRPDRQREVIDPQTGARIPIAGPDGAPLAWILPLDEAHFLATTPTGVVRGTIGSSITFAPAPLPSGTATPRVSASDAAGETLILDRAGAQYAITYDLFRRSTGVATPLVELAYPGGAAISRDGRDIVVSGTPMPCAILPRCPIHLWRVDDSGALVRIATREDRAAYKPQLIDEGGQRWLVYQTTAYDDSAACVVSLNECRHDIVRRRFPDGPEEVIAREAIAFAAGPVARRAWLTHDGAECQNITCPTMRLHLVDSSGVHVIDERAGAVMPTAFSPDGTWLAYRDRVATEVVVAHLGTRATRRHGIGAPIGWIRLPR